MATETLSPPPSQAPAGIKVASAPSVKSGLPNGSGITIVTPPGSTTPIATDRGPAAAPYKAGSARAKMAADAQKLTDKNPANAVVPKPASPDRPGAIETPEPNADPNEPPVIAPEPNAKPAAADPKAPVDLKAGKGKANPWKLFEAEKTARAKAEQEIQTLKSSIVPEQERTALTARVEAAEKRAKELEEHIRFVDYEKSSEFVEKYDKPYKSAWTRAMTELKELSVTDPATGNQRPITSEDMLELVNMPLPTAITTAKQIFGDAAEYVMSQRNEIRKQFEAQSAALSDARKNGAEHQTRMQEQIKNWHTQTEAQIKQTWEKANAAVLENPETGAFFKPREGDQEWNQRLAKGFQLVDSAFSSNPKDPKLTPEQRKSIVERHSAVRNRAASWGPLKYENGQLKAKLEALEKQLKGYKDSSPGVGSGTPSNRNGQPMSARDAMMAGLQKIARPQ